MSDIKPQAVFMCAPGMALRTETGPVNRQEKSSREWIRFFAGHYSLIYS